MTAKMWAAILADVCITEALSYYPNKSMTTGAVVYSSSTLEVRDQPAASVERGKCSYCRILLDIMGNVCNFDVHGVGLQELRFELQGV